MDLTFYGVAIAAVERLDPLGVHCDTLSLLMARYMPPTFVSG